MSKTTIASSPLDKVGTRLSPVASAVPLEALSPALVARALTATGAVLLRGFDCTESSFCAFTERFNTSFSDYAGGALRWGAFDREPINGIATLLTATGSGSGQNFPIGLHGELYYFGERPSALWFYCDTPPTAGGQTTLCDGRALARSLSERTRAFFREHQLTYVRRLSEKDWQQTLRTTDLDEARRRCAAGGAHLETNSGDASVKVTFAGSALHTDGAGHEVFVNNVLELLFIEWSFESGWAERSLPGVLHASVAPIVVRLENGDRIPGPIARELGVLAESLAQNVDWRAGDVLLVDNTRVMHGRREGSGHRRIYVRLATGSFHESERTDA